MDVTGREETLQALVEASAWRVALAEADADTSDEFEIWLAANPANGAAWDQVQTSWRQVGDVGSAPELLDLRASALARARPKARQRRLGRNWIAGIAASFLILLVAGGILSYPRWEEAPPLTYATTFGERRIITLEDGSKVTLDANSEVVVRYSDDARRLQLMHGQARFDVAPDRARPFSVSAGDQIVVATGTAFNVDMIGARVLVTLIEGQVVVNRVSSSSVAPAAIEQNGGVVLEPGQQLLAGASNRTAINRVSIEQATSWEQGFLTFENDTLASIAERVSRYSEQPLSVAPEVANLRISGVFVAGDVRTFVDTVSRYLPVEARDRGEGIVLERSR